MIKMSDNFMLESEFFSGIAVASLHLPPEQGTIDRPTLVLSLQAFGYAGPLTWEIVNESDPVIRRKIMARFNSEREEFWINKE